MRLNVSNFASDLQTVLTTVADEAARLSGWLKRQRKLTGAPFVQALVFGVLEKPHATLEDFAQRLDVSVQALHQRLGPAAADCLRRVLQAALQRFWAARAEPIPVLSRFAAVVVDDTTTVSLPSDLADRLPGCGGGRGTTPTRSAGLKLLVRLNLTTGAIEQLNDAPARTSDRRCGSRCDDLPVGSLWLRDLGFFELDPFRQASDRGVFWISRAPTILSLRETAEGPSYALADWLRGQTADRIDVAVILGTKSRLGCRLVALRAPAAVVERRLRRLHAETRRRGRTLSDAQRELARWTILVTNLPAEPFDIDAVWALYRARWQIELLFKRWKSLIGLGQSRGRRGARAECELYAKLIAALVQHGATLLRCGPLGAVSATRAARLVQRFATRLEAALSQGLEAVIHLLERLLDRLQRLPPKPRRRRPSTRQLLFRLRVRT